jgi:hypothetical protein
MVYFGKIKNGKVELESPNGLPEGIRVRIEPLTAPGQDPFDTLGDDAVETGIADLAEQHDHYASGAPKRAQSNGR